MTHTPKSTFTLLTLCFALNAFQPAANAQDTYPETLISGGKFTGEVRYRYENVDQDGFQDDANAHTIRTNLGFETGTYMDFKGRIEAQIVQNFGDDDFNSTTNGQTAFPVVADPDTTELNELWLSWSGLPQTTIKAGRQKINLDNQRFIGTVDWRQNDQTFDALSITNNSIQNLDLFYSYVANVNRIVGDDNRLGDLDSQIHLANASYKIADWLNATAYGYWIDLKRLPAQSNKTYGVRLTGKTPITEDWTFSYQAEAATQDNHGDNASSYDENYYHISPAISGYGITLKAGYEELGGNGTNAFQTPLATGHKFNGWADAFLATPGAGLQDAYAGASYKFNNTQTLLDGVTFGATYHTYDSNTSSVGDFGDEINLSLKKTFTLPDAGQPFKKVGVLLKYADYKGELQNGTNADRQKIWVQVSTKF